MWDPVRMLERIWLEVSSLLGFLERDSALSASTAASPAGADPFLCALARLFPVFLPTWSCCLPPSFPLWSRRVCPSPLSTISLCPFLSFTCIGREWSAVGGQGRIDCTTVLCLKLPRDISGSKCVVRGFYIVKGKYPCRVSTEEQCCFVSFVELFVWLVHTCSPEISERLFWK